jgi:hypothetical protein
MRVLSLLVLRGWKGSIPCQLKILLVETCGVWCMTPGSTHIPLLASEGVCIHAQCMHANVYVTYGEAWSGAFAATMWGWQFGLGCLNQHLHTLLTAGSGACWQAMTLSCDNCALTWLCRAFMWLRLLLWLHTRNGLQSTTTHVVSGYL